MKRSGSTGGRGFVGWVAMVLAVVLLVGPTLREPEQFVMAQTNPVPAAKPVLDWLTEIQKIPVGEISYYYQKAFVEEGIGESDISMEEILDGLTGLAKTQLGISEGQFVQLLNEILGYDLEKDFGMAVEHTDFVQTPGLTPKFDEDHYLLTINCRQIELILLRALGNPAQGYDWGVEGLLLRQRSEKEFDSRGLPYTEEKELFIGKDKDMGKFYAVYTVRIIKSDDGTLVKWEQWKFVQGNPNPVSHRPMGPP